MIDRHDDVMKTFTDYSYELPVGLVEFEMTHDHQWVDKTIQELNFPKNLIVVLIIRGEERIIPKGQTYLLTGDKIILCGRAGNSVEGVSLSEVEITKNHELCDKAIKDISKENEIIVMIKRGKCLVIPDGNTKILEDDIIVTNTNF